MTKKRLLIIFCILILIVAIVVLNSTVFTLQKANVVFVTYDADTKAEGNTPNRFSGPKLS